MPIFVFVFLLGTNQLFPLKNYIAIATLCYNFQEFQTGIMLQCGTPFIEVSSKVVMKWGRLQKYAIILRNSYKSCYNFSVWYFWYCWAVNRAIWHRKHTFIFDFSHFRWQRRVVPPANAEADRPRKATPMLTVVLLVWWSHRRTNWGVRFNRKLDRFFRLNGSKNLRLQIQVCAARAPWSRVSSLKIISRVGPSCTILALYLQRFAN